MLMHCFTSHTVCSQYDLKGSNYEHYNVVGKGGSLISPLVFVSKLHTYFGIGKEVDFNRH